MLRVEEGRDEDSAEPPKFHEVGSSLVEHTMVRKTMSNQILRDPTGRKAFDVGQPVPRTEDPELVQGHGQYTDDINLPRQAYACIVRSTRAHGVIKGIDLAAALAMPGVLGAYSGKDLAAYGTLRCLIALKNRDGSEMRKPPRPALAVDKVRFVGDPVAFVVAETALQAKEAAEAVVVDIDPLPAVTRASEAAKPGAPQLYDEAPDNVALDYHYGDREKVKAAFAAAAHVTKLNCVNNRVVVSAMEPRSAIAVHDAAKGHWTFHVGCQGTLLMRADIADLLKVPPEKVRIVTGNVGGSFGMKAFAYPEYVCILHAARALGRPVKWTDERSGSFLSDHHGRDQEMQVELALDAKGRFLALRLTGYGNMGAYLGAVAPNILALNTVKNAVSLYRTPLLEVSTKCVFTNTTLVASYRGAGRPEANYYMERVIDTAAAELGIDRCELRRRNQIGPKELPFSAASGMVYDSGDFPAVFKRALEIADVKNISKRKRESRKRGMLRGLGVASFLEVTAPPMKEAGGIRFEPNGDVTIISGTLDYGQGHAAPFAQVLAQQLGIPFERISLVQGDSDLMIASGGTGGSRSAYAGGTAIAVAAAKVIEKGKQIAGVALEASAADVEFSNGRFVIAGTDRGIDIMELAAQLRSGLELPDDVPSSLDVMEAGEPVPSNFPNGCHIAEVEVDPETGRVEVVRYSSVNDVGNLINPLLVEGQVHGGVVQGIGQALFEHTVYDEDGQFLSASYMDYALPRADDTASVAVVSHPIPAKTNPLGVKGCGEAGCAGGLSSVMNALIDALSPYGIHHIDMPATPARVWQAIQDAKSARPGH